MIDSYSFQFEPYGECIEEIETYLAQHGAEVEDIDVVPQLDLYADATNLVIYTMRFNDALVGYAAFWIEVHPHHGDKIFAANDLVYVHPEHRGEMALKFFKYLEKSLFVQVDVISYSFKVQHDHPELMEHLGMTCTEKVYTKVNK